ncbi:aldehyde dehydrogenase family protein [Carboxylicivirga mesophila]|uniref:aldehyde dehydrogenase (NAD(+)) n=2 Tax=Carboxylicivirga mesophila TaxID=1166478 RepID=A0ABS5K7Q7_9BACT|nr:aldehyde dehydrogenase family protein [Carboxylicivirga mesophila]
MKHMLQEILNHFEINPVNEGTWTGQIFVGSNASLLEVTSPVNGQPIAKIKCTDRNAYDQIVEDANTAFLDWRNVPAPKRGEIVRQFGDRLREEKEFLGKLVAFEMGKSLQESYGEVQEMIDICDFAVGLSRQLYGLTMHSERPMHRMYEQWHPLGIVGIISAFNFPVAVWSWNSTIAWICGNVCIWKASEKTPLTALVCQKLIADVLKANNLPGAISSLVTGTREVGEWMSADKHIPLISATGSVRMGQAVAQEVAKRFGKSLLELGGNNAMIITENADLNIAIPATYFGAIGTSGQRCTSTRRLIVHESVIEQVIERLLHAYQQVKIGNPLDADTHMGPLVDEAAVKSYVSGIEECKQQGGKFLLEGGALQIDGLENGYYVKPSIALVDANLPVLQKELFAPLLYIISYKDLKEAIAIQNNVPQGLSSTIMTMHMQEAEYFLSQNGSDCGIANVNIGTSGAEIGGAFGGEKETGGGRESGSDAWKNYMRRQTVTINYSNELPLSQGIKFEM